MNKSYLCKSVVVSCLTAVCLMLPLQADAAAGNTLWTTFGGSSIGTIDISTGAATVVGPTGQSGTYGVAEDPTSHTLYASFGSSIGTVNKTTGAVTVVGNTGQAIYGIVFDPAGQMWATTTASALYKIDKATGTATLVGSTGSVSGWMDISFDNGGTLYGVADKLYTINTSTGASTLVAPFSGACTSVMGIAFSASGVLYALDFGAAKLCTMDPATGVTTLVGSTAPGTSPHGGEFGTPAVALAVTPAPTLSDWAKLVLALVLAGGGALAIQRRGTRT